MAKMPLVVLLLPLIITAVTTEALPDAVVSFNATSPSKSEGKQSSKSAAEKGVLRQEETFFTGQRLVNPYVFIQETASRDYHGNDGERSGRYVQVRVLKFESNQVKEKCHFNPLLCSTPGRAPITSMAPVTSAAGIPSCFQTKRILRRRKRSTRWQIEVRRHTSIDLVS